MNTRGQYGYGSAAQSYGYGNAVQSRGVQVGAFLVHTLELKQRYNNVKPAAAQALLNDLARQGTALTVGANRWEIALKEGTWVQLAWHPDSSALEITITDRELRPADQVAADRRRYEGLLHRITPRLQSFGATTVGGALVGQTPIPRLAARTRAIRAVFDMYTQGTRMPYYLYAEVNGAIDKRSATSLDEANAMFFALESLPGEIYVSIFDPTHPLWPGPAFDVYNAAPQLPANSPTQIGRTIAGAIVHTREEFEQALEQLNTDFSTLMREVLTIMGGDPEDFLRAPQATADIVTNAIRDPKSLLRLQQAYAVLEKSTLYPFYKSTLVPLYAEWNDFLQDGPVSALDALSGGLYGLGPEVFAKLQRWQERLLAARAATDVELSKLGKDALHSASSVPLPKSWIDKGEEAAQSIGSGLGDIGKVLKYTLIGALAIGGVFAVSSLASKLQKEPVARRPRTPRAPRAQLALPPGEPVTEGPS